MSDHNLILSEGPKLPDLKTGIVIVALGAGAPRAFLGGRGPTLSERLFGKYSVYVEVDVAEKTFTECLRLPSQSATMFFDGTVQVRYRVIDAARLVERAIRDGKQAIWPLLEPVLQRGTRRADGANVVEAEKLAQDAVEAIKGSVKDAKMGLEILAISVAVTLDAETTKLLADVERKHLLEAQIRTRQSLEEVEREWQELILARGPRAMLAQVMSKNPATIAEILNQMALTERERYQNDIAVFRQLLESGDIEGHEIPKGIKDEFIESVLNRARAGDVLMLGKDAPKPSKQIDDKTT